MKRILFYIHFSLIISFAYPQWTQQYSGTSASLSEIYFLNKDTGFAVGSGVIQKTLDGGINWQPAYSTNCIMEGIYFSTPTICFVVGQDVSTNKSALIKSTNGGSSWTNSSFTSLSLLNDVHFSDKDHGWIVGRDGIAYKSSNGGNKWDTVNMGTTSGLQAVFFTDSLHGVVVGGDPLSPLILKTIDGGKIWNTITSPAANLLQGVFFSSPSVGYAVGWTGEILKTIDGGDNWTSQTSISSYGNLDLFFTDDNTGYIVGGSANVALIQKTTDGGKNWFAQSSPVNAGLIGVFFPSPSIGYIAGANGTILKTGNGGAIGINDHWGSVPSMNIFPNPFVDKFSIGIPMTSAKTDIHIKMTDLAGREVLLKNISVDGVIDPGEISAGTYIFTVETAGSVFVKKIVKE